MYHPTVLSGSRLGVYEVAGPLGAGGMGEVYRARDTRLNRDVALKLLPASVAADPERLARFTREAQLLAALNHPNIAAIHGLEESGGQPALVLELVDGETLANRLARGAVPVDEAVGIMRQIAEGLEFAHEQGIVHRDLKPANVMLRPDGTVKLLDFGLAKALGASGPGSSHAAGAMHSPTMVTSPATAAGHHPRHRGLHGSRAGARGAGGSPRRYLGLRRRLLRAARRGRVRSAARPSATRWPQS